MHKHRDDAVGVPFLFLTPTRRPISRSSSRASSHSVRLNRPDTPNSGPPSPLTQVFRRPHTPLQSPLSAGQPSSYMSARSESPNSSPVLAHAQATYAHAQFSASLPASPLSSPRLLNAKAHEFKPIPRPLSSASSNPGSLASLRADTPSPDLWANNSPRAPSNLAIAAPLLPDQGPLPRSLTPSSSLRSSLRPEEDEEDPFDPFAPKPSPSNFDRITVTDFDTQWTNSSNSNSSLSPDDPRYIGPGHFHDQYDYDPELSADTPEMEASMLTDGMTPFDVLSSVFGTTLAPSELEDALANNGYDFDRSMAWLVDRALPSPPQAPQMRMQNMGGRVTLVSNHVGGVHGGRGGYQAITPSNGRTAPRYINGRLVQGGNRVCRYFVAGECLRADCRYRSVISHNSSYSSVDNNYSHDLERALCRFWLRGTCAKGEQCEFLHHLPKDVDVSGLTTAMSRTTVSPHRTSSPPPDEFPALSFEGSRGRGGYRDKRPYQDPGRTRFAAAVKKAASAPPISDYADPAVIARREAMGIPAESLHHRSAIVAPRPSPRQKLRPPSLMPTLPTGEAINSLYMTYRSRALQLGAARNACLSRAADAWRRGDGAAAKRFSREGHDLNAKMGLEMADAAGKLVRERAKLGEAAVRGRDSSWSDDAGDRTSRGRICGGGLGICLGIASKNVEDGKLTPEERTESMLDLHGLHSNEATEVLEEFLLAVSISPLKHAHLS